MIITPRLAVSRPAGLAGLAARHYLCLDAGAVIRQA